MRDPDYIIERDGQWLAKLYCGDCLDVLPELETSSIDAVITDPPYDEASVILFSTLGEEGGRILKTGGNLLTYFGQYSL